MNIRYIEYATFVNYCSGIILLLLTPFFIGPHYPWSSVFLFYSLNALVTAIIVGFPLTIFLGAISYIIIFVLTFPFGYLAQTLKIVNFYRDGDTGKTLYFDSMDEVSALYLSTWVAITLSMVIYNVADKDGIGSIKESWGAHFISLLF